ncbi:MAG: hypothetical protein HOP08_04755 [Cyclobacteriaceae bacterium]|nr:hypothetical protein [Cyclobacteriaceae bacterium]
MKRSSLIILHVVIWLTLSLIYFFTSETIIAWLLPGIHEVGAWLMMLIYGWVFIFILVVTSLVITLKRSAQ